ncbi:MAG: hypothetical protein AAF901_06265 [Bacteroidota bacterium]
MTDFNASASLKWWDKKRVWYNVIVGVISIGYLIYINPETFESYDIIGVIIYALGANLFFTLGFLLEMYDATYFKGALRTHKFRMLLFVLGTLFSVVYTIYQVDLYYYGPLVHF